MPSLAKTALEPGNMGSGGGFIGAKQYTTWSYGNNEGARGKWSAGSKAIDGSGNASDSLGRTLMRVLRTKTASDFYSSRMRYARSPMRHNLDSRLNLMFGGVSNISYGSSMKPSVMDFVEASGWRE